MNENIKSFVIRNGRCGAKQSLAYLYGLVKFGVSREQLSWNIADFFGRDAKTIVEIGFGMGQSLIQMAQAQPQTNFLAIEVHRPGIGQVLHEIMRLNLTNIRIVPFDAVHIFKQHIPANSLDGIQIYFPDPWPKKRHHKRRLVQTPFMNLLAQALKPGAYLHCATDWAPYAEFMLEQLAQCPTLTNCSLTQDYVQKPDWRPTTKFETRGEHLGHQVFDLLYQKQL
jgi:tRNA (guanine-N7-)-methyltransferase